MGRKNKMHLSSRNTTESRQSEGSTDLQVMSPEQSAAVWLGDFIEAPAHHAVMPSLLSA
jgi:hypothetical protein